MAKLTKSAPVSKEQKSKKKSTSNVAYALKATKEKEGQELLVSTDSAMGKKFLSIEKARELLGLDSKEKQDQEILVSADSAMGKNLLSNKKARKLLGFKNITEFEMVTSDEKVVLAE